MSSSTSMVAEALLFEPDLAFDAWGRSVSGPILVENGIVVATGSTARASAAKRNARRVPLAGQMLLPAFANAHSHAFQRALRGRVERRPSGTRHEGSFWTWRQEMYRVALQLGLDALEAVAAWCYLDMVRSGFVSVAEFHYLHHDEQGRPFPRPAATTERLARAARRVGLELVVLQCAYGRGGFQRPALEEQRRFVFSDAEAFLQHAREVRDALGEQDLHHGLALHSVRACPRPWIEAVAEAARAGSMPLHVHACEQPAEVAACREEHGVAPVALLDDCGALFPAATLVHATHLEPGDPERIAAKGAGVCLCPSTEGNLGDGLAPIAALQRAGVSLSIGTDSHARIDAIEELRALEMNERMRTLRRGVLSSPGQGLAEALLPCGIVGGAKALGLRPPDMIPGARADWVAARIPLEGESGEPSVAIDAWLTGGSARDLTGVFRGGERLEPAPADVADIEQGARAVLRALSGRE